MHLLFALGLATLLAPLNSTMVAVALPEIRSEFNVGVVAVTWLVIGYLVAVAVAQPIGGRLGDAAGHLSVLRAGLLAMGAFSLLSALAPSYELLVATRSAQGLAAAFLIPNATAAIRRTVPIEELGRSLGLNGAFAAGGAAAGPVVGGILLALGDWRLLFLSNLPVAGLAFALVVGLPREGAGRSALRASLDLPSIGALLVAFAGLALAGTALRSGEIALVLLALGLAAGGALGYGRLYRRRHTGIVDLAPFASRTYSLAAAMTGLSNLVMYTTLIAVPIYLRDQRDSSTLAIGGVLFALSATMAALSPAGGWLADRFGIRAVLCSGAAVIVAASATVGVALETAALPLLVAALGALGIGIGLATPAQQTSGMAAWPGEVAGSAAGTLSLMRYVGSVTGASLLAVVLGSSPSRDDFAILFAAITAIAGANLAVALLPPGPTGPTTVPVAARDLSR